MRPSLASRTEVLRAAADLFVARGYDGVSMDDIRARAGGSKQTLYARFSCKAALFAEALEDAVLRLPASPVTHLDEAGPLRARLETFGSAQLAMATAPDALALRRTLLAQAAQDHGLADTLSRLRRIRWGGVAERFGVWAEAGQLRPDDPWRMAMTYRSLLESPLIEDALGGTLAPPARQDAARHAADIFLRAYGP